MESFCASWALINPDSDNFEKYMVEVDVPCITRKVVGGLKPDVIISKDGDVIKIRSESTFKNHEICFKLGEEFDEVTADGRKTKTNVTLENDVLVQLQKWKGKESTIKREIKDDQMVTVSGRNLRFSQSNRLVVPPTTTAVSRIKPFSLVTPYIWNAIPESLRRESSFSIFKTKLKDYLWEHLDNVEGAHRQLLIFD